MKPFLTNATPNLIDTMPHFCMPIARCLTTNEQIGLVDIDFVLIMILKNLKNFFD